VTALPFPCEVCGQPASGFGSWCDDCYPKTSEFLAREQITGAVKRLEAPPESYLRWPFDALDRIYGGMSKGTVHFLSAFSGGGKTTMLASTVNRWLDAGRRVYVLPLETEPETFRTYVACERLGIHAGDALSGDIHQRPNAQALIDAIKAEIVSQHDYADRLIVDPVQEINFARFAHACRQAEEKGADVVIVDHIDHVEGGDGTNLWAESVKVVKGSLRLAKQYRLRLLLSSQLNLQATHGDKLAKYQPPQVQHLYMGGHKIHVATGIVGLFRPLRDRTREEPATGDKTDRYLSLIQRARRGEAEPSEVLERGVMGVVLMKSRNHGQREGARVRLAFNNGRVQNLVTLRGAA
jgi:KaiC/GvpD/RAD55 family RecA-like ATPase